MYYTQHKAIKLHLQPFHVEGAADRRGISADSVERRGWQDWGGIQMKQQQNGFASPSLLFPLRTAERDAASTLARSLNKAEQTVFKARCDSSVVTP